MAWLVLQAGRAGSIGDEGSLENGEGGVSLHYNHRKKALVQVAHDMHLRTKNTL